MAAARCTAVAAVVFFPSTFSQRPKKFSLESCLPTRGKCTRRKNHLRPKILKTLNPRFQPDKIIIPAVHDEPLTDSAPTMAPEASSEVEGITSDFHLEEEDKNGSNVVGSELAESVEVVRDEIGVGNGGLGQITAKDWVKFGFWFLGWFVFQTVCAVWVLSRSRDGKNDESLLKVDASVKKSDEEKVSKFSGNDGYSKMGNLGPFGGVDVEKRIEEIKLMAREARRNEKRVMQDDSDDDDEEEDVVSASGRTDIQKEIGSRLEKLRKQFHLAQKSVASTGGGHVEGVNAADSSLMFKRKLKFRSPPVEESSRPRGFNSLESRDKAEKKKKNSPAVLNAVGKNERMRESEIIKNMSNNPGEGEMSSYGGVKMKVEEDGGNSGDKLRKSTQLMAKISDDLPIATIGTPSNKPKHTAGTKKDKEKQLVGVDDQWWLNLPCVFAILMRRGPDSKYPSGLFSLQTTSEDDSDDDSEDERDNTDEDFSYVIAFQDRYDANNFCYLLESFFEDLGDFGSDIVPLLKNDLKEMVQEQTKIFVVRKGQLQLYAGQPFPEVELALKSMIPGSCRR